MPKVAVYNQEAKKAGEMDLSEAVFGVSPKEAVVHQVYVALEANARQPWAHVKERDEVRGGGRKPWRQKGTGRARHGSTRSPIWAGGGVTFGPRKSRNFKQKINKKTNRLAVAMCLSDKVAEEQLVLLDELKSDGKTKTMATLRNNLPGAGKSTLLLTDETDAQLAMATKNMDTLHVQRAIDVNVVDLLHHQYILATKKAVEVLEKRLG